MARSMTLMGAVEDLEGEDLAEGADDEAIEVPGEVRDAEDEVSDDEDTLEEAGGDIETLEEVKEILDDAADNGEGLDETAAKIVEATVEKIYARLGIQSTSVVGSLESFKNPRSRVTATRMAAEEIGEKVSRAWEAVKKFFRELWEKIKGLWKKYATAVGRLKARATALRTKIRKGGSSKKEETFDSKEYARAFTNGKGAMILDTQLSNTLTILKKGDQRRERMANLIDGLKGDDKTRMENQIKTDLAAFHLSLTNGSGKNDEIEETKTMVGNRAVSYYLDQTEQKFVFDVYESDASPKDLDNETVTVEDKAKLESQCSSIIEICDQIDRDKDKVSKIDKKILAKLDSLGKTKKDADDVAKADARNAQVARELLRANGKFSYLPEKIAIAGCHKALSYIARCASMYEK